jgi:hypothetical protein
MNLRVLLAIGALSALSLPAAAEYAGIPQRVYLGRTYLIYPVQVRGPVWYAGDGRIVAGDLEYRRTATGRLPAVRKY